MASGNTPRKDEPRYRIVLASHLSTTGFLDPVLETSRWLDRQLAGISAAARPERRDRFWDAFFLNARFAVDCESLDREAGAEGRSCWELPKAEEQAGEGPIEILFPGESALRRGRSTAQAVGLVAAPQGFREHLVVAGPDVEEVFRPGVFSEPAVPARLAELEALFGRPEGPPPPRAFLSILDPEPQFGTRTFGFTVDEAFRLLRQDHEISDGAGLALVLPGGGVKAAYQSRIVDELYGRRYLQNFRAGGPKGRGRLDVQYVIGTSGGALIGFFVSQLGLKGPWNLTDILWKKDKIRDLYLRSSDIFGWTDLLRYLSMVASFLVLCVFLGIVSIVRKEPLGPSDRTWGVAWRLRLSLAVLPLLLAAPLLVRLSNERSGSALEQVPEFEGLIYAVLLMLVMFADQCLVMHGEPRPGGRPWVPPALPLVLGGVLVVLPLLAEPGGWLTGHLTFGPAFAVLAPVVLFGGLILPLRLRHAHAGQGLRGLAAFVLEMLAPTVIALAFGLSLAGAWLNAVELPFYMTGFLLILVLLAANFLLRPTAHQLRGPRWWAGYGGALLLASLLVMKLCWPGEKAHVEAASALAAHTLELSVGTFFLCVGLLVTLLGGMAWAYTSQRRYRLEGTQDFIVGFVVVIFHLMTVATVLWVATEVRPDWLSPLELTGEFWAWLVGTSLIVGCVLLLTYLYGRSGRAVAMVQRSFAFLCSHHPNGDFVTRRFLRLALLSVFGLAWWNLVVAPALYGNRQATAYLEEAMNRFYAEPGMSRDYHPTAHFITPANLLERDGTRYFLFAPDGAPCPPVPKTLANGAMWYPYSVGAAAKGCRTVKDRRFLNQVIFASGSPFPIFPAHRLTLEDREVFLVDGGYSNNVPVDAARTVAAKQVLIVESTCPLSRDEESWAVTRMVLQLRGKLVENLGRLPGFMFERSQQMDRLSGRDLFVVSISPSREERDWPPLFDFRRKIVKRMKAVAEADFGRRVGMVQSWGRPAFALSVEVRGRPRG